jgi:protein phosphatase
LDDLREMLNEAHREIRRRSETSEALSGMGTTFTMAYVVWPRIVVVHAGDTRCYVFSKGQLSLLTRDHTVANEMMRNGKLNPNNNERSPWANVLVNALGAGAEGVQGDLTSYPLEPDDIVMMCSDGLNKHVDDETIERVLAQGGTMQSICEALIDLAKKGGGTDNITVVASQWSLAKQETTMRVSAIPPCAPNVIEEMPSPIRNYGTVLDLSTHMMTTTDGERSGDTDPLTTEAL